MSADLKIKDIYNLSPNPVHRPGDIWDCLPTFGTLPTPFTRAIIITPACDLAQGKTNTITYLPIISLRSYFLLPSNISDLISICSTNREG